MNRAQAGGAMGQDVSRRGPRRRRQAPDGGADPRPGLRHRGRVHAPQPRGRRPGRRGRSSSAASSTATRSSSSSSRSASRRRRSTSSTTRPGRGCESDARTTRDPAPSSGALPLSTHRRRAAAARVRTPGPAPRTRPGRGRSTTRPRCSPPMRRRGRGRPRSSTATPIELGARPGPSDGDLLPEPRRAAGVGPVDAGGPRVPPPHALALPLPLRRAARARRSPRSARPSWR